MRSIQSRLCTSLFLVSALVTGIVATALSFYLRSASIHQLDRSLAAQATLLSSAVELNKAGQVSFDNLPTFARSAGKDRHATDFYEMWDEAGEPLFRSQSLGGSDLQFTRLNAESADTTLSTGRVAREFFLQFHPFTDDEPNGPSTASQHLDEHVKVQKSIILGLAHDRSDIDEEFHVTLVALIVAGVVACVAVLIVVPIAVKRALAPVRQIGIDADTINVNAFNHRFDTRPPLPLELQPICYRLNDLMDRLQQAFEREKRFTADVAHELRTPIAELQAMTEVSIKWPLDHDGTQQNLQDTLSVVKQMSLIVSSLLNLARCEAGQAIVKLSNVGVRDAVLQSWNLYKNEAVSRSLQLVLEVGPNVTIMSDPTMLIQILANLISNAVTYATPETDIRCKATCDVQSTTIVISNNTRALTSDDLPHLFEAFWRKDSARASRDQSGLGLSIASAFAKAVGCKLTVALDGDMFSAILAVAPSHH